MCQSYVSSRNSPAPTSPSTDHHTAAETGKEEGLLTELAATRDLVATLTHERDAAQQARALAHARLVRQAAAAATTQQQLTPCPNLSTRAELFAELAAMQNERDAARRRGVRARTSARRTSAGIS